jgi:hypothetical protein
MPFFRPRNKEELFNLCHASAPNVIECIFGVLKQRFRILLLPSEYDMKIQAHIPPALCAIHNFICQYDPREIEEFEDSVGDVQHGSGSDEGLATGPPSREAQEQVDARQDQIAEAMWKDYVAVLAERGM